MRTMQLLHCQSIWQCARIPNLQSVTKQHYLHTGITCIIPMAYCIHYGLFYSINRQFWACRYIRFLTFCACSHPIIDTAHHETCGLINKFKYITPIYLICRHRLFHHISIELHTFNLRRNEIFLRFLPKQQYCRICQSAFIVYQVKMRKQ